jgi:hypothetical protein
MEQKSLDSKFLCLLSRGPVPRFWGNTYNNLKKINNKNRRLFTWLNIKNKISIEILKSLSIIHSLNHNSGGISVKLPKKICSKNLNHNIVNLIGGGFEYICSGKDSLSNISFKAQLLPTIRIYFKK